jgi:hypothetical protein
MFEQERKQVLELTELFFKTIEEQDEDLDLNIVLAALLEVVSVIVASAPSEYRKNIAKEISDFLPGVVEETAVREFGAAYTQ